MASGRRVVYMSSKDYLSICDQHPKIKERASITDSLIDAYGLKACLLTVVPKSASKEDLLTFHSVEFVKCLEKIQNIMTANYSENCDESYEEDIDYDNDEELSEIGKYGFGYDCAVFRQLYDYCKAVVGATLGAANILMANKADVTINLNGGWHHAHVDEAAGFCYINDAVIGILKLMNKFKRILYIDLDVHHGDGVEEAFMYSKKVMTLSLHNYENGFFPGTGGGTEFFKGIGKYFTTNVPLKNGMNDSTFVNIFQSIFNEIMSKFRPEVIVCQCGADGLTGDPMGNFNLTSHGLVCCVEEICSKGIPVMVLGGGGYNIPNTARCWTEIVAAILGKHLAEDIPDHDYLDIYGPDYSLSITPSNRKNENTEDYLHGLINIIKENIPPIPNKAFDQRRPLVDSNEQFISTETNENTKSNVCINEFPGQEENNNVADKFSSGEMKCILSPKKSCPRKRILSEGNLEMSSKNICMD